MTQAWRPRSIVTRTLLHIGSAVTLVLAAMSLLGYFYILQEFEQRELDQLGALTGERGKREGQLFDLAADGHKLLRDAFLDSYHSTRYAQPELEFSARFFRDKDGCIRSRPERFNAAQDAGVWINRDAKLSADLQRRVLLFQDLTTVYGRAWRNRFLNTYMLAPENVAVPFWPSSPDIVQLLKSDFMLPKEEYFRISTAELNPQRKTVWTGLYADPQTKIWMVSVETPVYEHDRHIATIGNDIPMDELVARTIEVLPDGTYNAIFRADGRLIAHPHYRKELGAAGGDFLIPKAGDEQLKALFQAVTGAAPGQDLIRSDKLDAYIASTRLASTGWYYVRVVPRSVVRHAANASARVLLGFGLGALLLNLLLLFLILRRDLARPLSLLTRATDDVIAGRPLSLLPSQHRDEFGQLAQSFVSMYEAISARDHRLNEQLQQLALEEHRLRQAQEQAQLGSWEYQAQPERLTISDTLCTLLAWPDAPVSLGEFLTRLDQQGWQALSQPLRTLCDERTAFRLELALPASDRQTRHFLCLGLAESGAGNQRFSGVIQDVSERVSSAAALRESEYRFQIAFDAAPIGFAIVSPQGDFLRINPRLCQMLGYDEAEMINRSAQDFTHPDDRETSMDRVADLRDQHFSTVQFEKRYLRKNGEAIWALVSSNAQLDSNGKINFFLTQVVDISERKQAEQELNRLAFHDALTGLPNRGHFTAVLRQAIARVQQRPQPHFAVLFLDLDRFKNVNDSLGHLIGDQLLLVTAGRLKRLLRPTDAVCRFGGDEFCVLLEIINGEDEVKLVAERILESLSEPVTLGEDTVRCSVSIGMVLSHPAYQNAEEYLRDADSAMYHAKKSGKAQFAQFDVAMLSAVTTQLRLENELRIALGRQDIQPWFQPIVQADDGQISGFEALARWQHPERGTLAPVDFIPVAEELNLLNGIDLSMLAQSLSYLKQWQLEFDRPDLSLNWNASAQLLAEKLLAERLLGLLQAAGIAGDRLNIEITESALIQDPERILHTLYAVREIGINIHLDDFGTGYSSLSYLHRFPIQQIKIDRSFIARMHESDKDRTIVESIILLARRLQIKVTAEGVENETQRQQLRSLGIEHLQGYAIARPMPPEQVAAYLRVLIPV